MIFTRARQQQAGVVVVHPTREHEPEHERAIHFELAKRIGGLLGLDFAGTYDADSRYTGRVYFLPTDTLVGRETARNLGINGEHDLFGGVTPYPFMATKAITHDLLAQDAARPEGWSPAFAKAVRDSVLHGITAFTLEDARKAGERLLKAGPIRLKPVRGVGGRGQILISCGSELADALKGLDAAELSCYGVVLEEHLDKVTTYSVGKVRMADVIATYFGTQRLTPDNHGEMVYGGSDLVVVRGDFDVLLKLDLPEDVLQAIVQARAYDEAATAHFKGFFASRRNYDIAQGLDSHGRKRSGVLEQSWRTGGASSAEIAALEAFDSDKSLSTVRASSIEIFGRNHNPPSSATVLFSGEDKDIGLVTKSVMVESYGNT
jgi:hypothetical protein